MKKKKVAMDKSEYEKKRRDRSRLKEIKGRLKPINKILEQIK